MTEVVALPLGGDDNIIAIIPMRDNKAIRAAMKGGQSGVIKITPN